MLIKNALRYDGKGFLKGDFQHGASDEEFDASGKLAFPAFNNGHTHLAMTLMRGAGEGKRLEDWLNNTIFPTEKRLTPELVYNGSMMGLLEMIKTGTSFFIDQYYFVEQTAKAVKKAGIRARLGIPVTDFPTPYYRDVADALGKAERFFKEESTCLVEYCLSPHSIYVCSEETLTLAKDTARRHGAYFMTHVSETRKECVDCYRNTGMWPVEYLHGIGLLDDKTILAHAAWLTKMEIKLLADSGCTVIHCPASNMKLASGGVMPLHELLAAGVPVGLGTDGACSNNSLDMMQEMKFGSLLQKMHRWDATAANAKTMMGLATLNSKDLAFVRLDDFRMLPHHDLIANLVYSGSTVTDLLVEDRVIMKDEEILTFDEDEVKRDFKEAAAELIP